MLFFFSLEDTRASLTLLCPHSWPCSEESHISLGWKALLEILLQWWNDSCSRTLSFFLGHRSFEGGLTFNEWCGWAGERCKGTGINGICAAWWGIIAIVWKSNSRQKRRADDTSDLWKALKRAAKCGNLGQSSLTPSGKKREWKLGEVNHYCYGRLPKIALMFKDSDIHTFSMWVCHMALSRISVHTKSERVGELHSSQSVSELHSSLPHHCQFMSFTLSFLTASSTKWVCRPRNEGVAIVRAYTTWVRNVRHYSSISLLPLSPAFRLYDEHPQAVCGQRAEPVWDGSHREERAHPDLCSDHWPHSHRH